MENWDARQSQHIAGIDDHDDHPENNWNIVELESRRHLRSKINELIHLTVDSTLTTTDLQHQLSLNQKLFGSRFVLHLVRALQHEDQAEREAVVWLLTLLNAQETIIPLQQMAHNERLSRPTRLSASLALAGMGATPEMGEQYQPRRLYAIS
ncbi:MAG: FUSC family protein [Chloroflexota bacterium]|nr:FUSC family protein [Chloroflexota bacterium]